MENAFATQKGLRQRVRLSTTAVTMSHDGDTNMYENVPEDIRNAEVSEIQMRKRMLENEIRMMRSEFMRLEHDDAVTRERITDNTEKISQNKVLPYLVGNVVEILDIDPDIDEDSEDAKAQAESVGRPKPGKCAVIKTSTRQTIFLPLIGLVPADQLEPGDLIGVNKDSYLILDKLPSEYDSRVKAMEVDERPTETYTAVSYTHLRAHETRHDRGARGSHRTSHAAGTKIQKPGYQAAKGRPYVWPARYGQNALGPGLRCTNECLLPQAGRSIPCANVYR